MRALLAHIEGWGKSAIDATLQGPPKNAMREHRVACT
jgi:hypothetical protein